MVKGYGGRVLKVVGIIVGSVESCEDVDANGGGGRGVELEVVGDVGRVRRISEGY